MSSETGKVKFFNEEKRFGFIVVENSGKEIFVHSSGTTEPIKEDDQVEFEIEQGDKGLYATKVRVI